MRQVQILGKIELFDKNLSVNRNMACSFCHMPYTGFSGPISSVNATTVAYPGSVQYRFGKRKPQGYTYSPYYPVLSYNDTQGDFYGGNFWDLRATGYRTQSPDAEQAQGPPLRQPGNGTARYGMRGISDCQGWLPGCFHCSLGNASIRYHLAGNAEQICSTPEGAFGADNTPLGLSAEDRGKANAAYDQYALAITAYVNSLDVSAFSAKFDKARLTQATSLNQDAFRFYYGTIRNFLSS